MCAPDKPGDEESIRAARAGERVVMKDFPKPAQLVNTDPYREATALSQKLNSGAWQSSKKKVAIMGGGLSGLACAKYLSDAGHEPLVLEARDVLGGKVSAWQDEDGDWIETGLHIFFGAYPNMMNLLKELQIRDRLEWAPHRMSFAMRQNPGQFTNFEFPANVPAPFNMAAAILTNREMLSLVDKIKMVPGLLPMLIEGQDFIDAQDELSVLEFMEKYGMPATVNEEIFIAMAKALVPTRRPAGTRASTKKKPRHRRFVHTGFHRSGPHVDDGHIDGDEPLHQRGRRLADGLPRRQPAGPRLRADRGARPRGRRRRARGEAVGAHRRQRRR